jgi:S1-C subfamily serine protease
VRGAGAAQIHDQSTGETVKLTIIRRGKEVILPVALSASK